MNAPLASSHFPQHEPAGPRFREAGDVTLDLLHRDARAEDCWLGLQPREFALLWRLAELPGERLSPAQLRADAWRNAFEPEGDGIAAHIARLRIKLAAVGLGGLIGTDPDGCHFLDVPDSGALRTVHPPT